MGGNNGDSWANAFLYLQDALDQTNNNSTTQHEVWVAQGVYYPDLDKEGDHSSGTRSESFKILYNNVKLYGGFTGTETALEQRDWNSNITVLSGDIDENDTNSDGNNVAEDWLDILGNNAYHVLWIDGSLYEGIYPTDVVIDGFTITGGDALDDPANKAGGGINCRAVSGALSANCSPRLSHLVISGNTSIAGGGLVLEVNFGGQSAAEIVDVRFIGNYASSQGGGILIFSANDPGSTAVPVLVNVSFIRNYANNGGGLYNMASQGTCSPLLVNIEFVDNEAGSRGGGMYNQISVNGESQISLINSSFYGNEASQGGAIYNGYYSGIRSLDLINSILWGNTAAVYSEIYNYGSMITRISNSDIQGSGGSGAGWDTTLGSDMGGNIDQDPLFNNPGSGDLALKIGSPAVDAGDELRIPADSIDMDEDGDVSERIEYDLAFEIRVKYDDVDMGAYELQRKHTFDDVPDTHFYYQWVEALYKAGITGGCSTNPPMYCPDKTVTRAEMAVFLERGIHGSGFIPPDTSPSFGDTAGHWAEDWIEALYSDGITGGCSVNPLLYCPDKGTIRAEMAVFLVRSYAGYDPPSATGVIFNDVPKDYWAAPWIEKLAADAVTGGCGGGSYCPEDPVTRAQMAVFLVRAFGLPMP